MSGTRQKKYTQLFILAFVCAGFIHVLEVASHNIPDPSYTVVTFFFCLVFIIYPVMLIFWIQSVHARLLPSASRRYMIATAVLMILYLCLRAFRYRFTESDIGLRYGWYAYYVPMTLMPALFLCVCIRMGRGRKKRGDERLLLIPGILLAMIVMTNDLHHFVFVPKPEIEHFIGSGGTYTYTPLFYLIYAWIILTVIAGVIILLRESGRGRGFRKMLPVIIVIVVWMILLQLHNLKRLFEFIPPYETPEANIFAIVAIFEICIREHLIPHNENYAGFFSKLPMPVMITDISLKPVHHSANIIEASEDQLKAALDEPVYIQPDKKLMARKIRGGYAFRIEDESAVHSANERLMEANELQESENTLIEYENKQKEENAYLSSRHHIYRDIAEKMYPYQTRIKQLLDEAQPGEEAFMERIAYISVLNAYVKRKTNFLLLASGADQTDLNELQLAVSESGRYLSYVGVKTSVDESGFTGKDGAALRDADSVTALYDSFERIAEQLIGNASLLMVSYADEGLKLATDLKEDPDLSGSPLKAQIIKIEGIMYITIPLEKVGEQ